VAFFSASAAGSLEVRLSTSGIVSDASNGLDYGTTSPSGSTGQEVAINALLAAAATRAGTGGVRVIWDRAVAIGAPIYLYSGMTIEAPGPRFGAIMRPNSDVPMWRVHGSESNPGTNTSTLSQQMFGKIDATQFGTTTGSTDYRFRIFDPTSVLANDITIVGGTWNGNLAQQTSPNTAGAVNSSSLGGHLINGFQMYGVDGLTIRDCRIFSFAAYGIFCVNCRRIRLEHLDIDSRVWYSSGTNGGINDAIHIGGPCTDVVMSDLKLHCNDDHIALNADDGPASGYSPGINMSVNGPITQVSIDRVRQWWGRENVQGIGLLRILSNLAPVDDISVRRWSQAPGQPSIYQGVLLSTWSGATTSGTGNVGRVVIDDCDFDVVTPVAGNPATFSVYANTKSLEIRNRYRRDAQAAPDIAVFAGTTVQTMRVTGEWQQTATGANNQPVVYNLGTIGVLDFDGKVDRDVGLGAATAPVLRLAMGAQISDTAAIRVQAARITNVVDVLTSAGSGTPNIGTLILVGSHRAAGGGSPVGAGTSGLAITNLIYGLGAYPFAYAHGSVSITSGTVSVTNSNDYVEPTTGLPTLTTSGAVRVAYWDASALSGSVGSAVTTLADQTGNGNDLTSTVGATVGALVNGHKSLVFAGATQAAVSGFRSTASWIDTVRASSTGHTIIYVYKTNSSGSYPTSNGECMFHFDTSTSGAVVDTEYVFLQPNGGSGTPPTGAFYWNKRATGGSNAAYAITGSGAIPTSAVEKMVIRVNSGATVDYWCNGSGPTNGVRPVTSSATWGAFSIGQWLTSSLSGGMATVQFCEMHVITGALNSTDVANYVSYMASKWGS
jgi:hypothetical protein